MESSLPTFWRTAKGEEINLTDMSVQHLQTAYNYAEMRVLHHYQKMETFNSLLDALELESRSRGVETLSIDQQKEHGEVLTSRRITRNSLEITSDK